jgi:hypothetical protein
MSFMGADRKCPYHGRNDAIDPTHPAIYRPPGDWSLATETDHYMNLAGVTGRGSNFTKHLVIPSIDRLSLRTALVKRSG